MIAGTPTSAGSIVDVKPHIGDMLVGIGKAEAVNEACKEPIAKPKAEKRTKKESDLGSMTKAELETYGRTIGLDLNKKLNKSTLLTQIEEATKK